MSTAGSGDVLSGIIGGLMAQGRIPSRRCRDRRHLHGKAGDIAADNVGRAGLVAGDITATIPHATTAVSHGGVSLTWKSNFHMQGPG